MACIQYGKHFGESTNDTSMFITQEIQINIQILQIIFCINKDTNQQLAYGSATYREKNRVNGIELGTSGGNIASGSYSLYGMRFS